MMVMIITTMFVLDIGFLETKFAPNAGRKKTTARQTIIGVPAKLLERR